jgi:hypothetical protein
MVSSARDVEIAKITSRPQKAVLEIIITSSASA